MHAQIAWHEQDIIDDEHLNQAVEATRNGFLVGQEAAGPRANATRRPGQAGITLAP
jgi:hypothetical protein